MKTLSSRRSLPIKPIKHCKSLRKGLRSWSLWRVVGANSGGRGPTLRGQVQVKVVVGKAAAVLAQGLPPEIVQGGPDARLLGQLPRGLAGLDGVLYEAHYVVLLQPDLAQRLQRLHPAAEESGVTAWLLASKGTSHMRV